MQTCNMDERTNEEKLLDRIKELEKERDELKAQNAILMEVFDAVVGCIDRMKDPIETVEYMTDLLREFCSSVNTPMHTVISAKVEHSSVVVEIQAQAIREAAAKLSPSPSLEPSLMIDGYNNALFFLKEYADNLIREAE